MLGNVHILWLIRRAQSYLVGQEGKIKNSNHFFNSRVVGFGPGTCCISSIAFNQAHFPVNFQRS